MTGNDLGADPGYTPYQREFIGRFNAEIKPGSVHLLSAPVGTGKSIAIAGCLSELVQTRRVHRILILTPAILVSQWEYMLACKGLEPVVVNGRMLRQLREELGNTPDGWPEGIYPMSVDLVKRPDIREFVLAVAWDLVVVDEAHALSGQRVQLVQALVETENSPSLLLATSAQSKGTRMFADRATKIDWNEAVAQFLSRQEASGNGRLDRVTRSYKRSDEEAAIATRVIDIARQLGSLKGMVLFQRAASSIASLEDTVARWVAEPEGNLAHVEALEELLQRVDQLHVDSRLDCFKGLVDELIKTGRRHVVTLCEYRATLEYLVAAAERPDFAVFPLHGDMSYEKRNKTISQFHAQGGILITTSAASHGLSLNFVDAAIHYDIPISRATFARREELYNRFGRDLPCTVYSFKDESGALPLENILLRMVCKPELVSSEMDVDMGQVFTSALK